LVPLNFSTVVAPTGYSGGDFGVKTPPP